MTDRIICLAAVGLSLLAAGCLSGGKDEPSVPRSVLELSTGPGNTRNSEGDFALLADGRILYAYSRFTGGKGGDHDRCVIAGRLSADKGESWSTDRILATNDFDPQGNVMSISFLRLKDGRLAMFYMAKVDEKDGRMLSPVMMKLSEDEGETWSAAREISKSFPKAYRVLNNARVFRTSSGRVLIPFAEHKGKVSDGTFDHNATLYCAYSDDDCATWKLTGAVPQATNANGRIISQEPGLFETTDGRIVIYFRTMEGRQWCAESSDGGLNWGAPMPTSLWGPLSPATIRRLKSGELICLWNDHEGRDDLRKAGPAWAAGVRTPLTIGLSTDDGRTWPRRCNLEDGYDPQKVSRYWYCYSTLLELDDRLLVAYCAEDDLRHSRVKVVPLSWLPDGR